MKVYHLIDIASSKWPMVNMPGVKAFTDFISPKKNRGLHIHFGVGSCRAPLFFPDAGKNPASLGL